MYRRVPSGVMTISVAITLLLSIGTGDGSAKDPPARLIDQHRVERRLNSRQLAGNLLAEGVVVPHDLRVCTGKRLARRFDQLFQVCIGAYIEGTEAIEEIGEVRDRRVAEDLL